LAFQSTFPFETTAGQADAAALLRALPAREGHWDELREPSGALREPWRRFFELLGEDGIAGLDARIAAVAQQVRDNDITYNVYADKGEPRPWALDLLPFLIEESDWAEIERAVMQRARLLNALMADVYGAQTLLQQGKLPPALVFGHRGYLRAVKGYMPPGGQFLQAVAVDLARAPDGNWTVMAHRTEVPSGLGYALENRLIVSSLFGDAFREMRVSRLAPSYSQLTGTLAQLARTTMRDEAPDSVANIALLTPGPFSETYFEHVFLARYLGIALVEGKDLTVRNDMLYLKTLAGLERVHVVLRRLDDQFCDPVELRADSTIGVPGLLQVMRAGNVIVSNVPGSGFIESPALHGFMPGIAQALLGEPLLMPGVPTWWCGEAVAREHAFGQIDEAYLVPTWPQMSTGAPAAVGPPGVIGGRQKLAAWQSAIDATPDAFTVQQPLPYSCTPRYESGALGNRPSVLRVYAIADINGGWHVLPGGFARLAGERQSSVSMQFGGSSVDTWVLSSQPSSTFTLLPSPLKPADLARKHRTVSSRAAENLFWAGRYGERAENNVRLLRLMLGSLEGNDAGTMFSTLVELALQFGLVQQGDMLANQSLQSFERTLVANLHESNGASSIGQNLASMARASGEIRGRLSNDHWRTILAARNDFRDALATLTPAVAASTVQAQGKARYNRMKLVDGLEHLATQLSAISGAQGDRMTRDEAWRLQFAGRHIERVWAMSTILRTLASNGQLATPAGFDLLLQLFDCTLTYRSLYPGRFEVPALIDLLVIEPTNPRGLYGVYARLCTKLDDISVAAGGTRHRPFNDLLPSTASLPMLERLCTVDADGAYTQLTELCDHLTSWVSAAANEISARYFSHANTLASQVSS
jgi:uncharacterized circularly permuted ATP-grasp superfamily protein/uncharacterized alpha-E superfamily protein